MTRFSDHKIPTDAMNCFTGSVMHVLKTKWKYDIVESRLLELGNGYLLEAGYDEYEYPEIKFESVPGCGKALGRIGFEMLEFRLGIRGTCFEQLRAVIRDHYNVVVWVNSEFLSYAPVYFKRPGHLHSIVLSEIGPVRAACFDPLIFDREQYSCFGSLDNKLLESALYTRVPNNEIAAVLGRYFAIKSNAHGVAEEPDTRKLLVEQAMLYFDMPKHRNAVRDYAERCDEFFTKSSEEATFAARRLFDHIRVLYIIPSLGQLKNSLTRGGFPVTSFQKLDDVIETWKTMAIMALKYQATRDSRTLQRLRDAFATVDRRTDAVWQEVLRHGG